MGQSEKPGNLFKEFGPVSTNEWEKAIEKDLKGADYNKRLIWKNPDGIPVKPYYREEDLFELKHLGNQAGEFPYTRGNRTAGNDWLIRQDVSLDETVEKVISKTDQLLKNGVESVNFMASQVPSSDFLKIFLNGIPYEKAEFSFEGIPPKLILDFLDSWIAEADLQPEEVRINLQWDPIARFFLSGSWIDEQASYQYIAECLKQTIRYPNVKLLTVNARYFKHAGSTIVQELAFGLAMANDYLAEMVEMGYDTAEAASQISFNFCVGPNYFFEISKFRAARMLWSKILREYDPEITSGAMMQIHSESSIWNKTVYDPHVNLLRSSTEAMSAVLGGIHSLTVLPFDSTYAKPDELSERLARNQQILLREEAYLNQVGDPAGGSYYVENITHSMAEKAWAIFQKVEEMGGFTEAFYKGWIQNEIVKAAESRDNGIALRKEILLGVNQYPNISEILEANIDINHIKSQIPPVAEADAQPLIRYRGSEPFDLLRLSTDRFGKRPKVFLLSIGNMAMRKARSGFAGNFFGCAGYEIIDNNGFDSVEEGIEKALQVKSDIIVLCSSDEEYAEHAPKANKLLKNRSILVIAGNPISMKDRLEAEGITHFIHVRSQLLDTLKSFNKMLGIPEIR